MKPDAMVAGPSRLLWGLTSRRTTLGLSPAQSPPAMPLPTTLSIKSLLAHLPTMADCPSQRSACKWGIRIHPSSCLAQDPSVPPSCSQAVGLQSCTSMPPLTSAPAQILLFAISTVSAGWLAALWPVVLPWPVTTTMPDRTPLQFQQALTVLSACPSANRCLQHAFFRRARDANGCQRCFQPLQQHTMLCLLALKHPLEGLTSQPILSLAPAN